MDYCVPPNSTYRNSSYANHQTFVNVIIFFKCLICTVVKNLNNKTFYFISLYGVSKIYTSKWHGNFESNLHILARKVNSSRYYV